MTSAPTDVDLTTRAWGEGEREACAAAQVADRTQAASARGHQGAVTVAHGPLAARAGLEALKQGGNAIDAAMTTALAQVALTAGAPISYFGILSLVYYDAGSGDIHTMNAEWNTVRGEDDPLTIPGKVDYSSAEALRGLGEPSGRTALVGGFMKGVEAAHARFGRLPFSALFQPAIEFAEDGVPVSSSADMAFTMRSEDLARLPETRETMLKPDGSRYQTGEILHQPRLADTLRKVAAEGADYMYAGPWAEKLVAAVQADGGHMTLEDLSTYDVIWGEPLVAEIANGYSVAVAGHPNKGGLALVEAQHLAEAAGLLGGEHWTESPQTLRTALDITSVYAASYLPQETVEAVFPGVDFTPESRVTPAHAEQLWERIKDGSPLANWKRTSPMHSDDVVVIDGEGNIAAITHSINCVLWGKTAIMVDGITIGDPGAHQQHEIARVEPGERLPAPTETGILLRDGAPVLGFASMGAGLHHRTFQGLLNYTGFGLGLEETANTADFFGPTPDPATGELTAGFPQGRFDHSVLDAMGIAWQEFGAQDARFGGEGYWVAIERDPDTGELHAVSHNRDNSDAVAF
ncbi:gamma-glutamyltransferase [Ornithinimicrobium faecis]|uniref:Gamma-glutamyltransferase n=1 Tax=Ornithinimicrobium faecis TaxID=2934158 RepID=A0ABY4YXT7_9MICO|nr:gamma-glutamyltransferase [Ornithinimicrobium sp. HY1793]USQ81270.1 gamma-glutamyltransferase [Ornithinimicrobium sp. HY1793]